MADEPERQPTAYHVLKQIDATAIPTFRLIDHVKASSAEAAVRTHAETGAVDEDAGDDRPGTYIAVPSRSWKPVTVTAETRTVLKLS